MSNPAVSFVIPTRNRSRRLLQTLGLIRKAADAIPHEIIVIDNASEDSTVQDVRRAFPSVRLIKLDNNHGAAARNIGLAAARAEAVFMLDDDSWPAKHTVRLALSALYGQPDLAAAACYVRRPDSGNPHEAGGLPGVFLGGGAVLRRSAAIQVGGYPVDYGYYVEEYDLCARLWQAGYIVRWIQPLLVWHAPEAAARDKNRIIERLVANNLRLWSRYAPPSRRESLLAETVERYRKIAEKENTTDGYESGLRTGLKAAEQNRCSATRPLTDEEFNSLFGLDHLRRVLRRARDAGARRVLLWKAQKGAEQILQTLEQLELTVTAIVQDGPATLAARTDAPFISPQQASKAEFDFVLPGTLSPGACLDLLEECVRDLPEARVIDPVRRHRLTAVSNAA